MTLCLCGCGQDTFYSNGYAFGHWNRSELRRNKLSEERIGINNPFYGKHHSEKHKQKISEIHKGKIVTQESRHRMSISQKGVPKLSGKNHPQYGKPLSEETKRKIRTSLSGQKNPSYGKPRHHSKRYYYNSPFQGQVCLRSTWELAYAKYLDSIREPWFYELETFELLGGITYTPDFFLPQYEKFVEIKGALWGRGKLKIEKFVNEYPFNIDVLFEQDLKDLGLELRCHI